MAELITVEQAKTFLVADLKAALKERGASIVGKKAELFERLCQLLEEEGNEKIAGKVEGRQSPTEQKIQEQSSIKRSPEADITVDDLTMVTNEAVLAAVPLPPSFSSDKAPEEAATSTVGTSGEASSSSSSSPSAVLRQERKNSKTTVCIDNFQRPLQARALKEWLEQTCDTKIDDASLWLNQIKTHCYVDFPTMQLAQLCLARVVGQRFPSNSNKDLEADITSVSASEAPLSVEATLRPGAWKSGDRVVVAESAAAPRGATESRKRKQPEGDSDSVCEDGLESNKVEDSEEVDSENAVKKQRVEITQQGKNTSNTSAAAAPAPALRELGGAVNMFKKATSISNISPRGGCSIPGGAKLFSDAPRKTACMPMLQWQPAPGAIVEKRLKARLMKASS